VTPSLTRPGRRWTLPDRNGKVAGEPRPASLEYAAMFSTMSDA
jgi:hypothetical protein